MKRRLVEDFHHVVRKNFSLLPGGLPVMPFPSARPQIAMRKTTRLRVRKQPLGAGLHRFASRCPLGAELTLNCYRQQAPFEYLHDRMPRRYPRPRWLRGLCAKIMDLP